LFSESRRVRSEAFDFKLFHIGMCSSLAALTCVRAEDENRRSNRMKRRRWSSLRPVSGKVIEPFIARILAALGDQSRSAIAVIAPAATGFRYSFKSNEISGAEPAQVFASPKTHVPIPPVTDLSRPLQMQDASMPQRVDEATAGFFGLTERSILDQ